MVRVFRSILVVSVLLTCQAAFGQFPGGNDILGGGGDLITKLGPSQRLEAASGVFTDAAIQLNASDASRLAMATAWNPGTKDFAISFWVYLDTSTATQTVLCTGATTNGQDGLCVQINSDGNVLFYLNDSVQAARLTATFTVGIADTTWTHITIYADRSGNAVCYKNGVANAVTLAISTHNASLGATGGNIGSDLTPANYLNGRLDSLLLFELADMSSVIAAMVSALYASGEGVLATDLSAAQIAAWGGKYGYDLGETSGVRSSATGWTANDLTPTFANIIQPPVYGSELLTNGSFETAGTNGGTISGTLSATVARSSNVATMTTATPHGLSSTNVVTIASCTDTTFNATGVAVTVTDHSTFTYASTGGDEGAKPDVTGVITTDVFGTWTEQGVGTNGKLVSKETTDVHTAGGSAVKLTAGTANYTAGVFQDLAVTAGATYRISFWTHGDGVNASTYQFYRLTAPAGNIIGLTSTNVTGTNWTLVSFEATIPAGCTSVRLYLWCGVAGSVTYFDDVSLSAVTTAAINNGGFESWTVPAATQLVANGNFDSDISGWTNNVTYPWDTCEHSSGTLHVACNGDGTPTTCIVSSTDFSVTSGAVYRIRYTVTRSSGTLFVGVLSSPTGSSIGYLVSHSSSATVDTYFKATATDATATLLLNVTNSAASDWTIDNVSIQQVPSNADTWTEAVAGSSLIYREDTAPYHGSHALAMQVDGANSATSVGITSLLTVGKLYSVSAYAKAASGTPTFKIGDGATSDLFGGAKTLTTSYAAYTGTGRPTNTGLYIARSAATSNTIFLDSITLTAAEILPAAGIVRGICVDDDDVSFWESLVATGDAEVETLAHRPAYDNTTEDFEIISADGVDDRLTTTIVPGDAGTIVCVLSGGATGDVYVGASHGTEAIAIANTAGVITATAGDGSPALTSDEDPTTGYRVVVFSHAGNGGAQFLMVDGVVEDTETQSGTLSITEGLYLFAENDDGTASDFAEASIARAYYYPAAISQSSALGITKRIQNALGLSP